MTRSLAAALVLLLALAPHAAAFEMSASSGGPPEEEDPNREPLVVRLASLRVGDRLRYESWDAPDRPDAPAYYPSYIIEILGQALANDRYGIARDVASYRVERYTNDALDYSDVCHLLLRGEGAVRRDGERGPGSPGSAGADYGSGGVLYGTESRVNTTLVASFPEACMPALLARSALGNATIVEGDRLPVTLVAGADASWTTDALTMPAKRTTLHDRPALALHVNVTDERLFPPTPEGTPKPHSVHRVYVVADGLPGVVETGTAWWARSDDGGFESAGVSGGFVLTGFLPGEGPLAPHPSGEARIPARHPTATFAPLDDARFVDAELRLAFPYREALQAALEDPRVRLDAWLDARPDARLALAAYDRRMTERADGGSVVQARQAYETDGGWVLRFADADASRTVTIVRTIGARTPEGTVVGAPAKVVTVTDEGEGPGVPLARVTPDVASARDFQALLGAHGIEPGGMEHLVVELVVAEDGSAGYPYVASTVPLRREGQTGEQTGLLVYGTLHRADVSRVYSTTRITRDNSLLASFTGASQPLPDSAEPAPFAPAGTYVEPGQGVRASTPTAVVVAAAATGLAALALLLKLFLLPLYTRLRRARLLDNPVRAALHAHVRDNPGAHLGALEAVAAVGKGAARRHLDALVKHGYLVETRAGGYLRYFAAGALPREVAQREALLLAGSHRAVYDLFAQHPTLSLREAAARLGMSAASVHKARRKLQDAGLLPAAPMSAIS